MRILIFLLVVAPLAFAAESGQTIKTTDGHVYSNATIIDVSPTGVVVSIDVGITNIAYSKLPQNLRMRYGYDRDELNKRLKQGIDGYYIYREDVHALAGAMIELKNGRFTYCIVSDVAAPVIPSPILRGKFTMVGNWLVLHNNSVPCTNRVMAVVDGRLALLTPFDYWLWKDTGKLDVHEPLYRRSVK